MSRGYERTLELLQQLIFNKQNLVDTLVSKGETASMSDSFEVLTQKAADYLPKTYVFLDENGNEVVGVLVEQETRFTAVDNDVREGKTYAGDTGPRTGTKVIPSYHTTEGFYAVFPGEKITIPLLHSLKLYEYTKFQAIICPFNTTIANSVAAEKVSMNDKVFNVQSTVSLADVSIDVNAKAIDLGITNNSDVDYVIHYFTYKEII